MSHISTGQPEFDALLATPAVQGAVARQIRYGQTRMLEAALASLMVAVGTSLLADGSTFALPSFRIVRSIFSETATGWISLVSGLARLGAIWVNGRQKNMPVIRFLGCAGGFFFWSAWAIGLHMVAPPLVPLANMAIVLAIFEFVSIGRATQDMYASNSLNLRRGGRKGLWYGPP